VSNIYEINCLTGKAKERPMTASEIELIEKIEEGAIVVEQANEQRKTDRQAVLDKLGLTADEAAALFG
jgi:uncharacterized protein YnzC (UPF0291/DUF896 family)